VEGERTIELDCAVENLAGIRSFVRSAVEALGGAPDCEMDLVQAIDEAVTNVLRHGYRGRPGPLAIRIERSGDRLRATIEDRAPAFDPTGVPEPDVDGPTALPGGMGIHLIRAATDAVLHQPRDGGGNVLTLVRTLGRRQQEER
jgi:serine/threonine-protein kinase RsbW